MVQGVVYRILCNLCGEEGVKTEYVGETARTSYDRGEEHWNALETGDSSNPMVEHMEEYHPEHQHNFSMKVLSVQKSPLIRQSEEGLLINSFKGDVIMNRKGEWGNNLPPRLELEENGKRKTVQEGQGLGEQRPPKRKRPLPNEETGTLGVNDPEVQETSSGPIETGPGEDESEPTRQETVDPEGQETLEGAEEGRETNQTLLTQEDSLEGLAPETVFGAAIVEETVDPVLEGTSGLGLALLRPPEAGVTAKRRNKGVAKSHRKPIKSLSVKCMMERMRMRQRQSQTQHEKQLVLMGKGTPGDSEVVEVEDDRNRSIGDKMDELGTNDLVHNIKPEGKFEKSKTKQTKLTSEVQMGSTVEIESFQIVYKRAGSNLGNHTESESLTTAINEEAKQGSEEGDKVPEFQS